MTISYSNMTGRTNIGSRNLPFGTIYPSTVRTAAIMYNSVSWIADSIEGYIGQESTPWLNLYTTSAHITNAYVDNLIIPSIFTLEKPSANILQNLNNENIIQLIPTNNKILFVDENNKVRYFNTTSYINHILSFTSTPNLTLHAIGEANVIGSNDEVYNLKITINCPIDDIDTSSNLFSTYIFDFLRRGEEQGWNSGKNSEIDDNLVLIEDSDKGYSSDYFLFVNYLYPIGSGSADISRITGIKLGLTYNRTTTISLLFTSISWTSTSIVLN